jgi:hypothetical protein
MLALTIPFWYSRIIKAWRYSAGWTQNYGKFTAIGVKPARLLEKSDISIGIRMYVEEKNPDINIRHVTCHELVHACSAHLHLPMWLNEGIAVVTTDRFLERPVLRADTLNYMKEYPHKKAPPTYRELSRMGGEAIAYQAIRGYWLVRYLEEKRPGLLKKLFAERAGSKTIEDSIVGELETSLESFWKEIDGIVTEYFMTKPPEQ